MYVNVAVLKETRPHERRVALVPSVAARLIKLGAKLRMQSGAGNAVKLADAAYKDVAIVADLPSLLGFLAVLLGAGNAAGGYAVTGRMLAMFQPSSTKAASGKPGVVQPITAKKG